VPGDCGSLAGVTALDRSARHGPGWTVRLDRFAGPDPFLDRWGVSLVPDFLYHSPPWRRLRQW